MDRLIAVVLVYFAIVQRAGAVSFIEPTAETIVFGNRSEVVMLTWKYQLNIGEVINGLFCGFNDVDGKFATMIFYNTDNSNFQINTASTFPTEFNNRIVIPALQTNQVGMNITQLRLGDGRSFFCSLTIRGASQPITSATNKLEIIVSPTFTDCLSRDFTGNEGNRFTTNCTASGTPPPAVTCYITGIYSSNRLSESQPALNSQLHYIVDPLLRYFDRIICFADGKQAGTVMRNRSISVRYPPSMPVNFRVTAVTNVTMTLNWEAPVDDGGLTILSYEFEYTTGGVTLKKNSSNSNSKQLILTNLTPKREYSLTAYAYNGAGKGNASESIVKIADFLIDPNAGKESDDDTILIVAIVVPVVLVLIVVIIIIYFVCCRNKSPGKQKYPTSYVEDSTDYPQKEYLPEASPYCSRVKKSPKLTHNESTSGYPDVVNQTNGKAASSNTELSNIDTRYKSYDHEFMSPSYEHSTKEYV